LIDCSGCAVPKSFKVGVGDLSRMTQGWHIKHMPEFLANLDPMPFAAAVQMEEDLSKDLRRSGYIVTCGHYDIQFRAG
jgi:hypothetical protein